MANIILITGGQRSGKSSYAQRLAMELAASKNRLPIYLATSRVWDEEHRKRIERHKLERQENWVNIEEEKYLSNHQFIDDDVVVIDCVTLWATNFFFDNNGDVDLSFQELCKEFESFSQNNCTLIFVTNEIGSDSYSNSAGTYKIRYKALSGSDLATALATAKNAGKSMCWAFQFQNGAGTTTQPNIAYCR